VCATGIPSHIDTHSVFEDTILSLSLGSACVMSFKRDDRRLDMLLPARSLLIISGEARYAWTHGICPRRSDTIATETGTTVRERGSRVSFTFRKVRRGDCRCSFKEYCDAAKRRDGTTFIDVDAASGLENSYVHEVRDSNSPFASLAETKTDVVRRFTRRYPATSTRHGRSSGRMWPSSSKTWRRARCCWT